jgi:hypothetical protein
MRTTLTLEPDVESLVKEAMRRENASLKHVVNAALRAALLPGASRPPREPYRVEPHHGRLLGHDPAGFNRLADELEDLAILTTMRHGE